MDAYNHDSDVSLDPARTDGMAKKMADREAKEKALLSNLKTHRTKLATLLDRCSGHWGYEDPIYRFYHQSFRVFRLQAMTGKITAALQELSPNEPLNQWFLQIVAEGTERVFTDETNADWLRQTRPIVEAFFHARYMLEVAVKYADLEEPPTLLPSGWAAFLYLFNLR